MISIVMPVYNGEKYIKDAILSVLGQTYQDWELIIIDDCSSDHGVALARGFSDPRIRVVENNCNRGVAYSRSKGIGLSRGEWVAFLDADDMWEKEKLARQVDLIKEKDAVLVYTGSAFIDEDGKHLQYVLPAKEKIGYEELLGQNILSCSSVLVRKDILRTIPFPGGQMIHEDFAVWLAILRQGYLAYGIDEPLLVYRLSKKQKSANKLAAAIMNWHTYRHIDVPLGLALWSQARYAVNGIRKYGRLSE